MKNGKWFPGATGQHKSGEFHVHNGMNKCICVGNTGSFEEAKATASLIASAPEMLKALKGVNQCLDNQFQHKDELIPAWIVDAYEIIEEAIAKAGGE